MTTAAPASVPPSGKKPGDTIPPMIPFNRPHLTGREFEYIEKAVRSGQLSGNGAFTKACHAHLQQMLGAKRVLLTHSCTGATR